VNGDRSQIWALRLLAVGIAVALWFALSYENRETRSEKILDADITYMRPDGMVIVDPQQRAEILISGPQDAVGRVTPSSVTIQVDLRDGQPGPVNVNLNAENVRLPPGLRVDRIRPGTLSLELDREVTRSLRVEVELRGEPAAGAQIGELTVTPPQVRVTGPEAQIRTLDSAPTAPISLDGHAIDFEEIVTIVLPDILEISDVQPPRVTVRIPLSLGEPGSGEGGDG